MGLETAQAYDHCGSWNCWTRIKHFCICVRTNQQQIGGVDSISVVLCENDLRRIYHESGIRMTFREFVDATQAEADKAARESLPAIVQAQAALGQLGSEQSLISIRFCIKLGPIRICVEWLL